jgi:lipopolysaccharide export system permease protein
MNRLDRYIGMEFGKALMFVMLALVPLFSFLDLIQQLDDVGTGDYGLVDALLYEVRMLAPRTLELLPFGALMGATIALVLLAQHSEVIAAQAAGISVARIVAAVLKSGLLLMISAALLDQFVVSRIHQNAVRQQLLAQSVDEVQQIDEGYWMHHDSRFIRIGEVLLGQIPADIDILELDDDGEVQLYIHAAQADLNDPENWILQDLVVKEIDGTSVTTEQRRSMRWESYMTSDQVALIELPPETMSVSQLNAYVRYLAAGVQQTDRYELALWQKLTLPLATGVMVLLATPFAFGTPRSTSMGKRVVLALGCGILFQIATQVAANTGLVFGLNPALTTLAIPLATGILALVILSRVDA